MPARSPRGCSSALAGIPGLIGVHPAGAGHPDRHPHQPHPVPVHADRHRPGRTGALGAAAAGRAGAACRNCATSPPTSRTTASAPSSASTATPRCGWACRCRRSRTRCTTPSASGRSRPSSARPTSTAWCWRPIPPGRPIPDSLQPLRVPGAGGAQVPLSAIATHRAHHRPARRHPPGAVPVGDAELQPRPGRLARRGGRRGGRGRARRSACPTTITGSYSGDAAEFQRSLASEPWLILAAVVVIYIVLGVLYESSIHPVTILSTLPSAGIGALLALMVVRHRSVAGGAGRASCC